MVRNQGQEALNFQLVFPYLQRIALQGLTQAFKFHGRVFASISWSKF
mgnify:CR=1